MHASRSIALLFVVLLTSGALAQGGGAGDGLTESFHRVTLSRSGELNVLIGKRTGTNPDIAVLLFAGYPGVLRLREEAGAVIYELRGNFLLRARRFLNTERTFTVVVDCPIDQWTACGDAYRSSKQHANDIADVVASVKTAFGARQVYVVGTSYGTVSSSFLARGIGSKIDGAIHTSTFTNPDSGAHAHGLPMATFDWSKAEIPQLFVHHKNDPCERTPYSGVVARKGAIPLITVEGAANVKGKPCDAFSEHGFSGRERLVMTAIHGWITQRRLPAVIGTTE